ncbi:uncharacterized protein AMSG_04176 [Thecamonas trahens ATCC 50062]|uniref:Uncharacterized protein n=1 Tax=Thecamonas trahens ATCC 50062 TaxID=461836 RepID=A0A0L0D774_THETB|nr:hypothetical protein AMSG_04176 [Thecamonas trahens ATCC 50062]KNC47941.1 hypothetical protein AMSG_04176 [Thecamonas trahens ATCC 50062]|eukprot:XP_013758960.1 hypothetical protein AMSG_04176 [Thecamonas trahens ATCC 50062]
MPFVVVCGWEPTGAAAAAAKHTVAALHAKHPLEFVATLRVSAEGEPRLEQSFVQGAAARAHSSGEPAAGCAAGEAVVKVEAAEPPPPSTASETGGGTRPGGEGAEAMGDDGERMHKNTVNGIVASLSMSAAVLETKPAMKQLVTHVIFLLPLPAMAEVAPEQMQRIVATLLMHVTAFEAFNSSLLDVHVVGVGVEAQSNGARIVRALHGALPGSLTFIPPPLQPARVEVTIERLLDRQMRAWSGILPLGKDPRLRMSVRMLPDPVLSSRRALAALGGGLPSELKMVGYAPSANVFGAPVLSVHTLRAPMGGEVRQHATAETMRSSILLNMLYSALHKHSLVALLSFVPVGTNTTRFALAWCVKGNGVLPVVKFSILTSDFRIPPTLPLAQALHPQASEPAEAAVWPAWLPRVAAATSDTLAPLTSSSTWLGLLRRVVRTAHALIVDPTKPVDALKSRLRKLKLFALKHASYAPRYLSTLPEALSSIRRTVLSAKPTNAAVLSALDAAITDVK